MRAARPARPLRPPMRPPVRPGAPRPTTRRLAPTAAAASLAAAAAATAAITPPPVLVAVAAVAALAALVAATSTVDEVPAVSPPATRFMANVLSRVPALAAPARTPRALANGHVETIFAALARKGPGVAYARELVATGDGGTVALDTPAAPLGAAAPPLPDDAPVLIVLPGLTGGSHDPYVQHLAVEAARAGLRTVVFNSRGTGGGPVTSAQFYSASFTGDMRTVVAHLAARHPTSPLVAAGYSLGANILVNYLAEEGAACPVVAAVSMCNPFDLPLADAAFQRGFNRVYDHNLASNLRRIFVRHAALWADAAPPFDAARAAAARTIRDFDDAITRVSFGFPTVDAYYAAASSAAAIPRVRVPLLCLQAADDPIAPIAGAPAAAIRANPATVLAVTRRGGHLGWCAGPAGPTGAPWCDAPAIQFLYSALLELYRDGALPPRGAARAARERGERVAAWS